MSHTLLEDIPEFLEIQRTSFLRILDTGLIRSLEKINPIVPTANCNYGLFFYPKNYALVLPDNTITDAFLQGKTYGCKIYVPALIYEIPGRVSKDKGKTFFKNSKRGGVKHLGTGRSNSLPGLLAKQKAPSSKLVDGIEKKTNAEGLNLQTSRTYPGFRYYNAASLDLIRKLQYNPTKLGKKRQNSIYKRLKFFTTKKPYVTNSTLFMQLLQNKKHKICTPYTNRAKQNTNKCLAKLQSTPLPSLSGTFSSGFYGINVNYSNQAKQNPNKLDTVSALEHMQNLLIKDCKDRNKNAQKTLPKKLRFTGTLTAQDFHNFYPTNKQKQVLVKGNCFTRDPAFGTKFNNFFSDMSYLHSKKQVTCAKQTTGISSKFIKQQMETHKTRRVSRKEWVCIGVLPLMTPRGHFIINGSHRIVVSQMARAPGIYYQTGDQLQATIVPSKGAWLRISAKVNEYGDIKMWVRITPNRKMPYKIFFETYKYVELLNKTNLKKRRVNGNQLVNKTGLSSMSTVQNTQWFKFLNVVYKKINKKIKHFDKHYAIGVITGQITRTLFNWSSYSLGSLGRKRINERLGVREQTGYITSKDIYLIKTNLLKLLSQSSSTLPGIDDDIDHLENRRVRTCGELLQSEIEIGMIRLKRTIGKQLEEVFNQKTGLGKHYSNTEKTKLSRFSANVEQTFSLDLFSKPQNLYKVSKNPLDNIFLTNYKKIIQTTKNSITFQQNPVKTKGKVKQVLAFCGKKERSMLVGSKQNLFTVPALPLKKTPAYLGDKNSSGSLSAIVSFASHKAPFLDRRFASSKASSQHNMKDNKNKPVFSLAKFNYLLSLAKISILARAGAFEITSQDLQEPQKTFSKSTIHLPSLLAKLRETRSHPKISEKIVFLNNSKGPKGVFSQKTTPPLSCLDYRVLQLKHTNKNMPYWICSTGLESKHLATLVKKQLRKTSKGHLFTLKKPLLSKETTFVTRDSNLPSVNRKQVGKYYPLSPSKIIGTKAFGGALREFFGSNPLSQYMDQTNPLAELTHKRRLSSLGPGGIDRASAGIAVRGIHPSHYGRICPIETPEGKNAGLVNSMTMWARVNQEGFLETPYLPVTGGSIMSHTTLIPEWNFVPTKIESKGFGGTKQNRVKIAYSVLEDQPSKRNKSRQLEQVLMPTNVAFLESTNSTNQESSKSTNWNKMSVLSLSPGGKLRILSGNKDNNSVSSREKNTSPPYTASFNPSCSTAMKIVASDLKISASSFLPNLPLPTRDGSERSFGRNKPSEIHLFGVSPTQNISVATSLIPFLEHDDATRALMGSNMQRQAVPLLKPQGPLVRTGLEGKVVGESGHALQAICSGLISNSTRTFISIDTFTLKDNTVPLKKPGFLLQPYNTYFVPGFTNKNSFGFIQIKRKGVKTQSSIKGKSAIFSVISGLNTTAPVSCLFSSNSIANCISICLAYTNSAIDCCQKGVPAFAVERQQEALVFRCSANITQKLRQSKPVVELELVRNQQLKNKKFIQGSLIKNYIHSVTPTFKNKMWRQPNRAQRQRKIQALQPYSRSNQGTVCVQRPALSVGQWVQKGDLIGDCSASLNGVLSLGQNIVVAYLPMEGFNFEDAIVVSNRLVQEELYTSIHVQRVEFDMDATVKKYLPVKIKVKKQKTAYKTLQQDWITTQNPHLLPSEKEKLNTLGIIKVGSFVGPGDVLVSKVFPVERKIAPSRHLLLAVFQEKKTKTLETDDTSLRVPKGIHGRVINVKIMGQGSVSKIYPFKKAKNSFGLELLNKNNSASILGLPKPDIQIAKTNKSFRDSSAFVTSKNKESSVRNLIVAKPYTSIFKPCFQSFYDFDFLKHTNKKSLLLGPKYEGKKELLFPFKITKFFKPKTVLKTIHYKKWASWWIKKQQPLVSAIKFNTGNINLLADTSPFSKNYGKTIVSILYSSSLASSIDTLNLHHFKNSKKQFRVKAPLCSTKNTPPNTPPEQAFDDPFKAKGLRSYMGLKDQGKQGFPTGSNLQTQKSLRVFRNTDNFLQIKKPHQQQPVFTPFPEKGVLYNSESSYRQANNKPSASYLSKDLGDQKFKLKEEYRIVQVRVYIAERKKLQVGDKMSGRHGNKGIVSTILPREDMPYLPDGTCVDMVLNPLGIPSRMNVGQVFECLLGLAASICGDVIAHTPFDEMYGPEASRSLVYLFLYFARLKTRADWLFQPTFPGKTILFDGRTGTPFEQWVTVGRAYMLKLIHMVDEKIHARSIGPRSLVTQQPIKGRARGGGQRLGEMELWAFEGFGAAYTLQEMLTLKSDDIWGREQVENSIISARLANSHLPETFKMMLFELKCLCLNVNLNTY